MKESDYELIDLGPDPATPIPKGRDIFYRCTTCRAIVPSVPEEDSAQCECKYFNIAVDVADFKIWILDYSKLEVLRKIPKEK